MSQGFGSGTVHQKRNCRGYVWGFLNLFYLPVLVSKDSNETSSEIKNKSFKILQGCNNTG